MKLAVCKAKRVSFFGFEGTPIFDVLTLFGRGMKQGSITTRASAVAFNFFIAIFPAMIFIFTLIPYIPAENFQEQLLLLIQGFLPQTAFELVESTFVEVIMQRSWGLLSFGFIAAVYFTHNGMSSLINAFNATYHTIETRKYFNQHLVALLLTFLLPALVVSAVLLLLFGQAGLVCLVGEEFLRLNLVYFFLVVLRWLVIICLLFLSISFLYYLAPAKRSVFRFVSAGSVMATIMIYSTSLGFSFFVNNFGQFNKLYGSLGGLLVLMIWFYFNAIGLIVGFEINASIASARKGVDTFSPYSEI